MTHVALFTWKPGTNDAQVQELSDALLSDALPRHREVIDRLLKPILATRHAVQKVTPG